MINFIIVDDETASHEIIEDYGNNIPYLSMQKNCYNAFEAMEYLQKHKVDLMFLDINMPKLTGFEFLKTLSNPPKVIVTTAHENYALEGYELKIDDYLLKPFSFQRFLMAVTKVKDLLTENAVAEKPSNPNFLTERIFIKGDKKHHQIKFDDMLYVEAYGNYLKVHVDNQTIVTHQTLSSFEDMLPSQHFIKVHKSFIVAVGKIDLVEGNQLHIRSHKVPIGKRYRSSINDLLM